MPIETTLSRARLGWRPACLPNVPEYLPRRLSNGRAVRHSLMYVRFLTCFDYS